MIFLKMIKKSIYFTYSTVCLFISKLVVNTGKHAEKNPICLC